MLIVVLLSVTIFAVCVCQLPLFTEVSVKSLIGLVPSSTTFASYPCNVKPVVDIVCSSNSYEPALKYIVFWSVILESA